MKGTWGITCFAPDTGGWIEFAWAVPLCHWKWQMPVFAFRSTEDQRRELPWVG